MKNFTKLILLMMLFAFSSAFVFAQTNTIVKQSFEESGLSKDKYAAQFDRVEDLTLTHGNKNFVQTRDAYFSESFEVWPPVGWTLETTGAGWIQKSDADAPDGGYVAYHHDDQGAQNDWLISPAIDISASTNPVLSFWQKNYYASYYDEHNVCVSTDMVTWDVVYTGVAPSSYGEVVIDLSAYLGQTIYVGFQYIGDFADRWYVDAVEVKELNLGPELEVNYDGWNAGLVENNSMVSVDAFQAWNSNVGDLEVTSATLSGSGFTTTFDVAAANAAFGVSTGDFTYSISLFDSYGDGWDGAHMDVIVDGTVVLEDITVDASQNDFTFDVTMGDVVETVYTSGSYEGEHSYIIYDENGNEVISDGPSPGPGVTFTLVPRYDFGFAFEPTTTGEHTATLTIESNGGTQVIDLVGYVYAEGSLIESFETAVPPNGWEANILSGTYNWEKTSDQAADGDYSAMFQSYWAQNGESAELISPQMDLTAKADNMLYFYYAHPTTYGEDMLEVYVTEDNGDTWVLLDEILEQDYNWHLMSYDLSAYSGDEFKVKFVGIGYYGQDIYIDQFVGPKLVNGNLMGYVYDEYTDEPMEDAVITLGSETVMSNSFGLYAIEQIPIGTYTITCAYEGYNTITEEIVITAGAVMNHDFYMLREAQFSVNVDEYSVILEPDQQLAKSFTISNNSEVGAANLDYAVNIEFLEDVRSANQEGTSIGIDWASLTYVEGSFGEDSQLEGTYQGGTRADLVCPSESIFNNSATGYSSAGTSDEDPGYTSAQQFTVTESFNTVTFWGLNTAFSGGFTPCDSEDPMAFEIIVYEDGGTAPGDVVSTTTEVLTREGTGEMFAGSFEIYQYTVRIPQVSLTTGWISLQGQVSTGECWFMWISGGEGTGLAAQTDGTAWGLIDAPPYAMCLSKVVTESWLTVTDGVSGSIEPGGSATVDIFFDAAGLVDVTKYADLVITHNGVVSREMESVIPAQMLVTPHIHNLSIFDIQFTEDPDGDSPWVDTTARTTGVITAGDGGSKYFLQDMTQAGSWNGIALYSPNMAFDIGDKVTVVGVVGEYYNNTQIIVNADMTNVVSSGNALPTPLLVSTGSFGEQFEGLLLAVENAECTSEASTYGEWLINDGTGDAMMDDGYYEFEPTLGNKYNVVGPLDYSYGAFKMQPRVAGDIEDITDELPIAPFNLVADVQYRDVVLSWGEPQQPGWVTYYPGPMYFIANGPERGTYFVASDFGFSYPIEISGIRHGFYDNGTWDSDTFTIKIYDADGSTLIFESEELTALPQWQTTEYDLGTTLTFTDNFMVAIVPTAASGAPFSLASQPSTNGYVGEPGDWYGPWVEWSTEVFMAPSGAANAIAEESTPFVANNSKVNFDNLVEIEDSEIPFASSRHLKTYNLYRNGILHAEGITDLTYTDAGLDDGVYTYYVTAVWTIGESPASNVVSVQMFYGTLEGTVVDAEYGVAIPDATIISTDGVYETTSDADGNFVFDEVEYGTHDFNVSADGYYGDTFMGIEIAIGETTVVEFALDREFPAPLNVAVDPYLAIISWNSPFGLTYEDDFEDYAVDGFLAEQSTPWTTWDGTVGGSTDALISDEMAQSGTQSVKIHNYQETDLILEMGNQTSGSWEVNLSLFISPDGDGGYYNILHDFDDGGSPEWAYSITFDEIGNGNLDAAGETIAITYNAGEWNTYKTIVDLDSDNAELYINGTMVHSWQWSLQESGGAGLNQLGAIDVFASSLGDSNPFFYMDDVSYGVLQGREVVEVTENPQFLYYNVYLSDFLVTETNNSSYQYEGLDLNSTYIGSASAMYSYMGDLHESDIIDVEFTFTQTDITAPTNLVATVTNFNDVDLTWEFPVAGRFLETVLIFRDGDLVYETDGYATSYTENVGAGIFEYYVQARYTGFIMSDPSNTAIAEVILPVPTNLTAETGSTIVSLQWNEPALVTPPDAYFENFEGTFPPTGWMKTSPDGGTGWEAIATGTTPLPGWTGGEATACPGGEAQMAYATWSTGGASSNDQWLISPMLEAFTDYELSFYMDGAYADSYLDNVDVLISTTGTDVSDFDVVVDEIVLTATGWVLYNFVLTDFVESGTPIYVAFREHVADNWSDGAAVLLDNVYYGPAEVVNVTTPPLGVIAEGGRNANYVHVLQTEAPYQELLLVNNTNLSRALTGYNIYRNDELIGSTADLYYLDDVYISDIYNYYVKADYSGFESDTSNNVLVGVITGVEELGANLTQLYPNPATNRVQITSTQEMSRIIVVNYVGQVVFTQELKGEKAVTLNTAYYEPGVYVVRIDTQDGVVTKRVIITK